MSRLRDIDERQRTTATQLAMLQQRSSLQHSSEQFGPLLTATVGAYSLGLAGTQKDVFGPTVTHGLPLAQLLLSSRGTSIAAGFRSSPWTTLGFPVAVLLLTALRDQIPGLAPKVRRK